MGDIKEDIRNENKQSANSSEQNFEFITETIKEKPVSKRKVILKTIFTCILALAFGAIACFTFVSLYPVFNEWLHPVDDTKVVSLGQSDDENGTEEVLPADGKEETDNVSPEDADGTETDTSGDEGGEQTDESITKDTPEDKPENSENSNVEEALPAPEVITQVVETVEKDLELDDYAQLYQQISDVAAEARRAVVTVTGVSANKDWFMNVYENKHTSAGLILAENGKEMLILTKTSPLSGSDKIAVTFCDGARYNAAMKKSDPNTDLSVIAVDLEDMSAETKEACKLAELGSSKNSSIDGTPVIAVGDPLGATESMAVGQITSHTIKRDMTDTNVSILTTDIYGSSNASGVIINLAGRVLGIITQDGASMDAKNLIRGYAISDMKDKLEKLSNGQELAYLGIVGMDVTREAADEYGVPMGAYVKQVVIDSPAMEAGIQNGDVIVKLGTTDITSFTDYKDAMLKCQPEDLMMVTVKRMGRDEYVELSYEITLGKLSR
ncbi:MAG: PDZ domain-containing protein [Lachnospiraceae bacterium]|nr:PDZ domain-containing protein [Lachnospiraceae bacterium]